MPIEQEKRKKHIARLPITTYPDFEVKTDEIAVSIPIFHSPVDSGLTDFDARRIKEVHAKGAIWTALSLLNNTDFSDHNVGIYFHVEDKIYDIAAETFHAFNVPEKFIRVMTIENQIPSPPGMNFPQYGKKYMFLEDDALAPERWLMMDSDAFVCKTGQKFQWYPCFSAFQNPSALNCVPQVYVGKDYEWWVLGVCRGAGIAFDPNKPLEEQEKEALTILEVPPEKMVLGPTEDDSRYYTCTQMLVLPTAHKLAAYIKRNFRKVHCDEFMLNVWQGMHKEVSFLPNKIGGLPKFSFESQYIKRDKSLDSEGYIAHIFPDNKVEQTMVDEYWDDFYHALLPSEPISTVSPNAYCGVGEKLAQSTSDKQRAGMHQYGTFYDLIFDAVAMRQGRPLRLLEIGVSKYGTGSLKAFQELEIVSEVVAIDVEPYIGTPADHATFYHKDAYQHSTIDMLKEKHDPFDIIIDDGSHDVAHQSFFLEHYGQLLAEGGQLICEDVDNDDTFRQLCHEHNAYGLDLFVNRPEKKWGDTHNDRILIKNKKNPPTPLDKGGQEQETPLDKGGYGGLGGQEQRYAIYKPASEKLTLHAFGIPYAATDPNFNTCAYVQRVWKFCKIMHNLGHNVIHYGHEKSTAICSEHVTVTDDDVLKKSYGTADYKVVPDQRRDDHAFNMFNENAAREVRKRAKENDFVLAFYGWGHKQACNQLADLPVYIVEPSIGYTDCFAKYRIHQSNGNMNFDRGMAWWAFKLEQRFPPNDEHPYLQHVHDVGRHNNRSMNDPSWNTFVIPNFYDLEHFEYSEQKDDYMLFLGRIHRCKGIEIAFRLAEYTNTPLVVAGQGDINTLDLKIPKQVEYVGIADVATRSKLYAKAIATVCPSMYLEPGLGVHVETNFAGTPPITTNWGAPMELLRHGINGYRCHSFDQFVWALENVDRIDPKTCRHHAMQFSNEKASINYHEVFHTILQNDQDNWWNVNPDRTNLDWLATDMTEAEIHARIAEISSRLSAD